MNELRIRQQEVDIKAKAVVEQTKRELTLKLIEKYHGLPGAVGIVDGTPVNFEQRPAIDGAAYFSRIGPIYVSSF